MKNTYRINTLLLCLFLFCYQGLSANYLCFTAEQAGSSVRYVNGVDNKPKVEYSFNGTDWFDWPAQTTITLENKDDKVYVRGDNPDGFSHETISTDISELNNIKCSFFQMKGLIAASGNVMSLIDGEGITTTIPCENCFNRLFYQCRALTTPPELPATELAPGCYNAMFFECTGLKETPELPATKLAENCYLNMFGYCSNLTVAPELPATTLENSCYANMLAGTSITEAPKLPATEMKRYCYSNMFAYCEKLTKAPDLPSTVLDGYCYWQMFLGCVSLIEAPELPATNLVENCYQAMFKGCINLSYIKMDVLTLDNDLDATKNWVDGIDGEGVFIFPCGSKYDKHGASEVPTNFTIVSSPIVIFQNPNGEELYRDTIGCDVLPVYKGETPTNSEGQVFKGWDPELTIHDTPDTYYYTAVYDDATSVEGKWLCFTAEEAGSTISYKNIGNNPDVQYSFNGTSWLPLREGETIRLEEKSDKVYIKGNNPNGFSKNANSYTRFVMTGTIAAFGSVMSLIDGEGLAAEIPSTCCFLDLFLYCSSLTKAPELTATVLNDSCYWSMFDNCTNLKEAPALPVMDLTPYCYTKMFYKCTNLTTAPVLPATVMQEGCYRNMFYQCENLKEAPELPATKLAEKCYAHMFGLCENLQKAPELLADELVKECYIGMFEKCSRVNYMKVGVMSLDNSFDATKNWVDGIDGEGVFIFPCGSKYDKHGFSEVPENFKIKSSPIVVFVNPDETELYRDTIGCDVVPEYKGETPTYGEGLVFKEWDKELTVLKEPDVYYFTAVYEEGNPETGNWLCFTAETDDSEVWYENENGNEVKVQYSLNDGATWISLSENEKIVLKKGEKVYIKGDNPNGFSRIVGTEIRTTCFKMTGLISASGSVMSLLDGNGSSTVIPNESCFISLFMECSSLTKAPELPATSLRADCYSSMFYHCTNLVEPPVLPATTLAFGCYYEMFRECNKLQVAPELPATTLAKSCYSGMFADCISLISAPKLPATELAIDCYSGMFAGCQHLTEAPELPATTLAKYCYHSMFRSCSDLTDAPALPATTLATSCYYAMFDGCRSLTKAPELPATSLMKECYLEMFMNCPNLNYIKVGIMSLDNDVNATLDWVKGIDGEGVFIFPCGSKYDKHGVAEVPENFTIISSPIVVFQNPDGEELYRDTIACDVVAEYKGDTPTYGEGLVFKGWDKELTIHEIPDTYYYTAVYEDDQPLFDNWLCFTAEEANSVVQYLNVGGNNPNVMYSIDGGKTWESLSENEEVKLVMEGDKVYLKGDNPTGFSQDEDHYTHIWTTGAVSASGSVMSLIDGKDVSTEIPNDYCFYHLFANSPALIKAPELPATELKKSCYEGMFENCAVLKSVPALPATTLADRCYKNMFGQCYMIKEAPELSATTLAKECYATMFSSCVGLKKTPQLPATVMVDSCYYGMFSGCYGLSEASALPATHLAKSCYNDMFWDCWNLEVAPELPATELAVACYEGMFWGCGNLTKAPELPATILADACYEDMFIGCANLTGAPELPAASLARECYMYMFSGCSNITYIKVGVLSLDNDFDATTGWVTGIDGEGIFIFPCGSKYNKHGVSKVPENFTIVSSPIVVFQNPDGEELYRDTIACDVMAEYKGETPTYGDGLVFKGWDKELTIHEVPDTYYYTAVYEEEGTPETGDWLCFTAEKANSYVYYQNHGGNSPDVQYSIDEGRTWQSWGENEVLILKNVGEKIYVRGTNPDGFSHMANLQKSDGEEVGQFTNFKMSGEIAASGSVMSLIDGKGESLVIPCDYCFAHLFNSTRNPQQHEDVMTTALTKAPELPATTLTMGCYLDMFGTCSLLKEAPVLPATELASSCYVSMFNNCRSLEIAPALPATKLSKYCYEGMFSNSGIVVAPELPATDLMDSCYWGMFRLCKNMESAPELLATELKPGCYEGMFAGCSNLNYIKVGVMTLDNDFAATNEWVTGVNGPGTFIFPCGSKYDKHGVSEVPDNFKIISSPVVIFQNPDGEELYRDTIGCDVLPEYRGETPTYKEGLVFKGWDPELAIHPEPDTFYYTAVYEEQAPITDVSKCLCFTAEEAGSEVSYRSDEKANISIQYSIDGGRSWQTLKPNEIITFGNIEDKVYLKGNNTNGLNGDSEGKYWTGCQFIMSGAISASGSVMSLIDGMGISSIIPNKHCFSYLFANCTSLTQAPELPATTLTDSCYLSMFMGCYSLKQAPELPATTLLNGCYQYMFEGCLELTKTPKLSATTLAKNCYHGMFYDCEKLTQIADLPAKTLADYCYSSMFSRCVGLTQAPALPAMELADGCYNGMFYDCNNLIEAPQLPATQLAAYCYSQMFENCAGMKNAPELPASELTDGCYSQMFKNCFSLNYIKVGVMSLDNDFAATNEWVAGVNGPGTFIFPCGSKYDKHGVSEVPENFKIISSPVVVFQNPDGEELYRDTIGCDVLPEYKGETPTYGEGLVFKGWDKELTVHPEPDTFYYTAVYEEQAPITDVSKCLCFTIEEIGSWIWYESPDEHIPNVEYSIDGGKTWQPFMRSETWGENKLVFENVGDKIYVRGINPEGFSISKEHPTKFHISGKVAASGSVMSLIDGKGSSTEIPSEYCFRLLFEACSLTQAPELPATTLTKGCYDAMFNGCTKLTQAPALPATTLVESCYQMMFAGCEMLQMAPELLSTTLADSCYSGMFYICESLKTAPALPATTLASYCYSFMFAGCHRLTEAPELPATELKTGCYEAMFLDCPRLNYIKVGVMTLDNDFDATLDWVQEIDGEGVFIFPCGSKYDKHGISEVPVNFKIISSPVVIFQNPDGEELYRDTIACDVVAEYKGETPTYGDGLVFKGWDKELTIHPEPDTFYYTAVYEEEQAPITDVSKCLCFTAERDGCEVWYVSISNVPDIQYSVDEGRTWNSLAPEEHVALNSEGDKVYFRGYNPSGFSHEQEYTMLDIHMPGDYTHFEMTGNITASGSVMSLIDGVGETTVIPNENCFYKLFVGCSSLTQAPELPATTLKESCYEQMFSMCTSLSEAPELPATTLAKTCYREMFELCLDIAVAPQLPAMTLASGCYQGMFSNCMSLTEAPELPATELAEACYSMMFSFCSRLTETPKLIATTLADRCYEQMFFNCPSLQNALELPATTLTYRCYEGMFAECTSLINAPELPATELTYFCYHSMFSGCTSLTTAPELPATELVEGCYERMFEGCSSLNYIKVGVMTLDNDFVYGSTDNWVSGVDGPGIFIFPCGSTYDKHGVSEVPNNFEILRGPVTVIFQNPDSTVLWKDTINCDEVPEYRGETPSMGEDYFFIGWDKELTALGDESVYYITAVYEDLNKYESLHLTVDDALYLVLPGGSETIGYELLEGGGSRYEIWYDGVMITEGAVTNDSTVQLICPENFIPGAYTATLVMYDAHNGRGASDFVFHVMLKDDPTNSYYVKVWNDVVICRNGDNKFVSYQWYKNRNIVEGATFQYYNDVELLDGEYLVYVTDQSGKSYFIEPKQFERVEASYSITAEPSIVNRGVGFTVVVSGVEPEQLKNARIVVYRNDGVVVNILDDVELENEMHLAAIGDYVIVLTVNDGKNANCKVLIK